jgi:predicted kinase
VAQAAKAACREHLRAGRDFAFNGTNILRQTRRRWIDLFADYGARVEIIYLEPPLELIHRWNESRNAPVPRRVIDRLADKLEPPTLAEAHGLTCVDH